MIGRTIAHYKILEKIGAGGMGVVYKAEDTKLKRTVALKFLPEPLSHDPDIRARFRREAQAAAALNHPNIVTIHDVSDHDGQPFFAMECVQGQTLHDYCRSQSHPPGDLIDIALQIASGLQAAHDAGIIHRDLKPANVLIDGSGRVKILDFGLAQLAGAERLTQDGSTLGTAAYMSPEQAQGQPVDHRADLFSFGTLLYEMLTGQLPFHGEHPAAILYAIVHDEPEPLSHPSGDISHDFQRIVSKCLAKKPDARYQSAVDLIADMQTLKRRGADTVPDTASAGPSLAVLPFINMSADPENEYFSDGLSEDLITALSKLDGLHVVSRTSAFAFKGKATDIRKVGEQLNVRTVLEGSVRRAGNRLRITAQLINVADGYHLWSEKYDRDMADVFDVQDEIAQSIVAALRVRLAGSGDQKLVKRHTDNMDAYHLYLQGRHHWNRRTESELKKALKCFQEAVARDDRYAAAHVGIADCYLVSIGPGYMNTQEAADRARDALKRALDLDPDSAEAHASMALLRATTQWDWPGAEQQIRHAIALNPGYATAHQWYAQMLSALLRHDEAWTEIIEARRLDPLSIVINWNVALQLYVRGRCDEALDGLGHVLELEPGYAPVYNTMALIFRRLQRDDDAVGAMADYTQALGDGEGAVAIRNAHRAGGYAASVRELIAACRRRQDRGYNLHVILAALYLELGDIDQAFAWLETACQARSFMLLFINSHPGFESLRSDPRYAALMQKMGLPA